MELNEQNNRLAVSSLSMEEIKQVHFGDQEEVKLVDKESGNEMYEESKEDNVEYGEYNLINPYSIVTLHLTSTM
jgi:hypothetical protein